MEPQAQLHKDGKARLKSDLASIPTEFPSLQTELEGGRAILRGSIPVQIGTTHGIVRTADVTIRFGDDYPKSEPKAWIQPGTFVAHAGKTFSDRHIAANGLCCLDLPAASRWNPKDKSALLKWLRNFVLFVHRQFLYDRNGGRWPGPEWAHGAHGWAQYVIETIGVALIPTLIEVYQDTPPARHSPCPCDSGRTWAQCHKRTVQDTLKAVPMEVRQEVIDLVGEIHAKPCAKSA
ncbi:MAG: SEC-C metal-binding domain-containing protein [Vulcanimicrobiaceae bacterium]